MGLRLSIDEVDEDYLRIGILAWNDWFSGTTRIYTGVDELSEFAARVAGFPSGPEDERVESFGDRSQSTAGGYCRLRFYCIDRAGHAVVEVELGGDGSWFSPPGRVQLTLRVQPAAIDTFLARIVEMERAGSGEAIMASEASGRRRFPA